MFEEYERISDAEKKQIQQEKKMGMQVTAIIPSLVKQKGTDLYELSFGGIFGEVEENGTVFSLETERPFILSVSADGKTTYNGPFRIKVSCEHGSLMVWLMDILHANNFDMCVKKAMERVDRRIVEPVTLESSINTSFLLTDIMAMNIQSEVDRMLEIGNFEAIPALLKRLEM